MNKELNLVEILKDCPEGMALDCTMYEEATLIHILGGNAYPIKIETPDGQISLNKYGKYSNNKLAKCVIFPKGKTTWEGFIPPCQFKDGDIIYTECNSGNEWISIYKFRSEAGLHLTYANFNKNDESIYINDVRGLCEDKDIKYQRLAIDEEKQQLLEALHSKGYKWNAETKEVEKIEEDKPKWNPDTLQPFDKVLGIRAGGEIWQGDMFLYRDSIYNGLGGKEYDKMIPYNDETKHLLGTNQKEPEFYQI